MAITPTIPSSRRVASRLTIWMIAIGTALCVLGLALFLQWFIYTDWMHRNGQIRIVGAVLAAVLTWFVVLRWRQAARRRQLELLERLETIRWMNDRIRNALQSIDLLAFAHSEAAEQVRASVDAIAAILLEVQQQTDSPSPFVYRRKKDVGSAPASPYATHPPSRYGTFGAKD